MNLSIPTLNVGYRMFNARLIFPETRTTLAIALDLFRLA
jgi:hypothetical protein